MNAKETIVFVASVVCLMAAIMLFFLGVEPLNVGGIVGAALLATLAWILSGMSGQMEGERKGIMEERERQEEQK